MVRTKSLAVFAATAAFSSVYTCPAGHTAICKQVTIHNSGALAVVFQLALRRGPTDFVFIRQTVAGSTAVQLPLNVVLQPADQLRATSATAGLQVTISGTELSGVAP